MISNWEECNMTSTKETSREPGSSRTVVVTGAGAGIGEAIARAFAAQGERLVLLDRDEKVVDLQRELGEPHVSFVIDVKSETSVEAGGRRIFDEVGPIDVLVNNAGIGPLAPAEVYPVSDWDRTMAVNLRGAFLCARAFAPQMIARGWGRIINMASQAAVVGIEGHVAYCASKAGLLGMTRCMALEWGPMGITVNAVSPTVVETALGLMSWSGDVGVKARAAIPVRRFALPAEVASAVLYLATDGAAMINGNNLMIDGGFTIV